MMNFKQNEYFDQVKRIYESLKADYPGSWQTITRLSKNYAEKEEFIICNYKAFNFDLVNNIRLPQSTKEKTPDALFLQNDIFYFVEFKSGRNVHRANIRQKIHEGINTLYQYCVVKHLATREEFIHFRFRYAVVDRHENIGKGKATFLNALQSSAQHYSLKNIEGLWVEKTRVCSNPQSAFSLFRKVSEGEVTSIIYVAQKNKKYKVTKDEVILLPEPSPRK